MGAFGSARCPVRDLPGSRARLSGVAGLARLGWLILSRAKDNGAGLERRHCLYHRVRLGRWSRPRPGLQPPHPSLSSSHIVAKEALQTGVDVLSLERMDFPAD